MQNRGLIRLLAIALALVCFYQLYFTFKTYKVERDAKAYGMTQAKLKNVGATSLQIEALAPKRYTLTRLQANPFTISSVCANTLIAKWANTPFLWVLTLRGV